MGKVEGLAVLCLDACIVTASLCPNGRHVAVGHDRRQTQASHLADKLCSMLGESPDNLCLRGICIHREDAVEV